MSGIRPPSKIPATSGRGLYEMTESEHNSRLAASSIIPSKHKLAGLQEPVAKRVTLAERAGQVARATLAAPPSNLPINHSVKAVTSAGSRSHPLAASTSSRYHGPSVTRPPSTTSFAHSVSGYSRPAAMQSHRPQTSMAQSRTTSNGAPTHVRSVSALDGPVVDINSALGKRKGKVPIPTSSQHIPPRNNKLDKFHDTRSEECIGKLPQRSLSFWQRAGAGRSFSNPLQKPQQQELLPRSPRTSKGQLQNYSLNSAFRGLSLSNLGRRRDAPNSDLEGKAPEHRTSNSVVILPSPSIRTPNTLSSMLPRRTNNFQHQSSIRGPFIFRCPALSTFTRTSQARSRPRKPDWREGDFLSKYSGVRSNVRVAWDTKGRLEDMELLYSRLKEQMEGTTFERNSLIEIVDLQRVRLGEMEGNRKLLEKQNEDLEQDLRRTKVELVTSQQTLSSEKRRYEIDIDDMERKHRHSMEDVCSRHDKEVKKLQDESDARFEKSRRSYELEKERLERELDTKVADAERRLKSELDLLKASKDREIQQIERSFEDYKSSAGRDADNKSAESEHLRLKLSNLELTLTSANAHSEALRTEVDTSNDRIKKLEKDKDELHKQVELYKSQGNDQVHMYETLFEERNQGVEREEALRKQILDLDNARRKLHNDLQDMKGNIRVFCRVRPRLVHEQGEDLQYQLPDKDTDKNIIQLNKWKPNANGIGQQHIVSDFKFDRVFGPQSHNAEIFGEISQLVQSALDGYNVCIFAYGQTGSGKTYTMLHEQDGMIPKAVEMIYNTSKGMEQTGWRWTLHGIFIEIYCEKIKDLLSHTTEDGKRIHEVKHQENGMFITDITEVEMTSAEDVTNNIRQAVSSRTTASTNMNTDSSRSHSAVILRLKGENLNTGETRQSSLCLVDLAGSENAEASGNDDQRKAEAKNINLSLSTLKTVMGQLKNKDKHVAFRNSKLTRILQDSLTGSGKTLMFVMVNPLQEHFNESKQSLIFANTASQTSMGPSKKNISVAPSSGSPDGKAANRFKASVSAVATSRRK